LDTIDLYIFFCLTWFLFFYFFFIFFERKKLRKEKKNLRNFFVSRQWKKMGKNENNEFHF